MPPKMSRGGRERSGPTMEQEQSKSEGPECGVPRGWCLIPILKEDDRDFFKICSNT